MPTARVIVTRPAREAARWVDDLCAAGVDAIALPLIVIDALDDPAPLRSAWQCLSDYDALMFVSAAAAEYFFLDTYAEAAAALRMRFWATGSGTTRALQHAGVPASAIDAPPADAAQFDSEALWACVRSQVRAGVRVLVVRGGDASGQAEGRDWLARQIAAAGGTCDAVAAYRRLTPIFGDVEKKLIGESMDGHSIWLFSSSQAIANLCRAVPDIDWTSARAVATHPRIGEAARDAGFGSVRVSRPSLTSLVASIESFE
ncbi:Uroporphyrinogen-III synthase [Variovorax sp. SRS16]|uniref:uroporphyrinogen-III synthase n=1 Tax=Variovorax sp. SRS16 TaxID=282217 RepID=UPI001318B374|nr:uroporphyrinogen-III synthase [Variovorax sp. SRS16]VTU27480.1 Uroporphyrinogen-III synthase [Variovorax sp. SRS16]